MRRANIWNDFENRWNLTRNPEVTYRDWIHERAKASGDNGSKFKYSSYHNILALSSWEYMLLRQIQKKAAPVDH